MKSLLGKITILGVLVLAIVSCDSGDPSSDNTEGATFWQDVAPLYFDNCVSCHREGGIGPFRLDNYEDAKTWAAASVSAIESRRMPPWLITDDGSCGEFRDSRALSQQQIDMVSAWVDAGRPEGTPRSDLQLPAPDVLEGARDYVTPNFTPEIIGGDRARFDEYRCFGVDPGLDVDSYLTGYDVVPGNESIVHHLIALVVDLDAPSMIEGMTNGEVIQDLDAEDEREGWRCYDGAGPNVNVSTAPVTWAPGQGIFRYPQGTGVRVGKDELVVLQMHYNFADQSTIGQSDQTTMRVTFEENVPRPAEMILLDLFLGSFAAGDPDEIPPGMSEAHYDWAFPVSLWPPYLDGATRYELIGMLPHMHDYGSKMRFELERNGDTTCLADVQAWDFDWQLSYWPTQAIALEPGDVLKMRCTYDTTNSTEPILPGWGTGNEMCMVGAVVVPLN